MECSGQNFLSRETLCSLEHIATKSLKMYYALFYTTVEDYIEKRAPYREEHLRLAKAASENGTLIMAGAFADPADGALFIFRGDSPKTAEEFAKKDPYVQNGIITKWYVRSWNVVVGER